MVRMIVGLAVLVVGSSAWAQALEPKDYSPSKDLSIRTLSVEKAGSKSRVVMVAVANRQADPVNVNYACTFFDQSGSPTGETSGSANAIPPQQEVVSKSISFTTNPSKVACRIELIVPTN